MLAKIGLLLRTVIHLKPTQIFHQVYYRLRGKFVTARQLGNLKNQIFEPNRLHLTNFPWNPPSSNFQIDDLGFHLTFLNLEHTFSHDRIDWSFEAHGKLWNYNLNYFEFLFHNQINEQKGLELIHDFCSKWNIHKGGLEPYPISLRTINWIKFLSIHKIEDANIDLIIAKQFEILKKNLEYHLLANHLLENAFSLLYGAYYLADNKLYSQAQRLLKEQLNEQICEDGAHYERSPMYHHIILYRLLDCINLVSNNSWQEDDLLSFLQDKAMFMLSWMNQMSFGESQIPMLKDAAYGIAPERKELQAYAELLGLNSGKKDIELGESGYRVLRVENLAMLVDVGGVSPSYQPGHAHADELNFLVYHNDKPILVDTGISTYEKNSRRQLERSTESHNCVSFPNTDSSEIWGGFRVGKRANVDLVIDTSDKIKASHDGFKDKRLKVIRNFIRNNESLELTTALDSNKTISYTQYLHFHPDCEVNLVNDSVLVEGVVFTLSGFQEISKERYMFAAGFNKLIQADRIVLKSTAQNSITIQNAN